jgi:hypothetical protein
MRDGAVSRTRRIQPEVAATVLAKVKMEERRSLKLEVRLIFERKNLIAGTLEKAQKQA